jgi:hypothetical protein
MERIQQHRATARTKEIMKMTERGQTETVAGVLGAIKEKQIRGVAISGDERRVLDAEKELTKEFGKDTVVPTDGNPVNFLANTLTKKAKARRGPKALTDKQQDTRNRKIGLRWMPKAGKNARGVRVGSRGHKIGTW